MYFKGIIDILGKTSYDLLLRKGCDIMQKKVLAIHDLSCFGRSSLVPIISLISAAGHQCVPLPTAVFSTHTAIPDWVSRGLTKEMGGAIGQYERLGLKFEAVYAGFLDSAEQIDGVLDACRRLKAPDGIILIDPVMGDNGCIYETYTPELCARMRELCEIADIITPNITEAAILLGKDPASAPNDGNEAREWMYALYEAFGAKVVLTGLDYKPGRIGSGCLSDGQPDIRLHRRISCFYPGTGDIFAAMMLGSLLNGDTLEKSCTHAGEFVRDCLEYTSAQHTDPMHGVQFEKLLGKLTR